jgi:hypothetical protein
MKEKLLLNWKTFVCIFSFGLLKCDWCKANAHAARILDESVEEKE